MAASAAADPPPAPSPDGSDASTPPTIPTPASPTAAEPAVAPTKPTSPSIDDSAATVQSRVFSETITVGAGDSRNVAEGFMVLPEGADIGGDVRTLTADDGGLGSGKIKLTDVAFFDAHAQWAVANHFELDASASLLAKQPSTTDEPVFQGGSLAIRRELPKATALALAVSGSPLLAIGGYAAGGALGVQHKHRLNKIVTFSMSGGANAIALRPGSGPEVMSTGTPYLVEAAAHAAVLVSDGYDHIWGGWLGVGYAVPVYHHGRDPVSGMELDPQPRLDFELGNAVQLSDDWDLQLVLAVLDRGDLDHPATRLPILDGGFDQVQITVGVSRRVHSLGDKDKADDRYRRRREGVDDVMIMQ